MPKTVEEVQAEREKRKGGLAAAVANTPQVMDAAQSDPDEEPPADKGEGLETRQSPSDAEAVAKTNGDKPAEEKKPAVKRIKTDISKTIAGLPVQGVTDKVEYFKGMFYSDPGIGKTWLSGSADAVKAMSPVLFLDIEGGISALREDFPDVQVVQIAPKFNDNGVLIKSAWETLQDVYNEIISKGNNLPWRTIVIDNITEGHQLALVHAMSVGAEKADEKGREKDPDTAEPGDWNKAGSMLRKMVRAFRDLDCNIIFNAWEAEVKDDETGKVMVRPSLPGKLGKEVPGYFQECYYLYVKEEKGVITRKLLTRKTGKFFAKTRTSRMPDVIEKPTMAIIHDLVIDK